MDGWIQILPRSTREDYSTSENHSCSACRVSCVLTRHRDAQRSEVCMEKLFSVIGLIFPFAYAVGGYAQHKLHIPTGWTGREGAIRDEALSTK